MDPLTIISLIQQGTVLIPKLIEMHKAGRRVQSPEDIAELITFGQVQGVDYLTATGIKIVDGKVVPL